MMKLDDKLNLIYRNLQEFTGHDLIKSCIKKNGTVNIYWGTAPTGRPHIAYFLPMTKIADFLKSGCHVTILFADLHAYLDNMKAPWQLLKLRTEYYELLIKGMLKALNVPLEKLRFIHGTDYQLTENYAKAVYQIIGLTSIRDASKAGCEVVKQVSDPLLSGIVYPLLQSLDEEFLGVDVQFGGVDQRKIFMYAEKYNPSLNFAKRAHLMNPMIPGLTGGKMSASEEDSKIDLLDTEQNVRRKLDGANCQGKTADNNGLLAFLKCLALPNKSQFNNEKLNAYNTSEEIETDFNSGVLSEKDLKEMFGDIQWSLMENLRNEFKLANRESLIEEAYPKSILETETVKEMNEETLSISMFPKELEALKEEFHDIGDSLYKINKIPSIMWSCRASGELHIGYLIPLRKLAYLSKKNWKVIILIEDIGAYLHSKHTQNKPSWDLLKERSKLYVEVCRSAFINVFGGIEENLNIVLGSQFQLSKEYSMLMYKSLSKVTENECQVMLEKMVGNRPDISSALSSVIYPCISVLDQLYLSPTVRLFSKRQSADDITAFDRQLSAKLSMEHVHPVYVYHDTLLSLDGKSTMACSKIGAKTAPKDITAISICDTNDTINRKMKKAFFDPKMLSHDPTLSIIDAIIWPILADACFTVKRTAENGGDVTFQSVDSIKEQLVGDLMHPGDVKVAASAYLVEMILDPLRRALTEDCGALLSAAFPDEAKKQKKLDKKLYNVNKIDLRIAVVESVVFVHGSYFVTMQIGLDHVTMVKNELYELTPADQCIVAVKMSRNGIEPEIVSLLTDDRGVAVRLEKLPYTTVVSFNNYEVVTPNQKESDAAVIVKELEENCFLQRGQLYWRNDATKANELRTAKKCVESMKIKCV